MKSLSSMDLCFSDDEFFLWNKLENIWNLWMAANIIPARVQRVVWRHNDFIYRQAGRRTELFYQTTNHATFYANTYGLSSLVTYIYELY